ncbi:hypothetical protein SSX86_027501 [Deinandra increscens subsp. villosa]|uniref:Uncharacterized protein n=1 Tax=Deinandra increscens subsp. villosa TaxID=3103831 RepID=A0AAP0CGW5_9ASTR
MSSSRSSSRYNSFDNRSSTQSDPSSSADRSKNPLTSSSSYALAISKSKSSSKNDQNLSAMVKKFMEKRSTKPKPPRDFVVAADVTTFIADDFKKKTTIRGGFGKLFGKSDDVSDRKKKKKAAALGLGLPEVIKPPQQQQQHARTLGTVLRSERELMSQNKEQETEILHLKAMLDEKNTEVDKLKDLCLKQRDEIKALKSAILFPEQEKEDVSEELQQAKQIIPTLQRQVTSLTGQLLHLAQDLAEVKADKYSVMGCYESLVSSPRTPTHEQEEASNSLELCSADHTTPPDSPDDMFLNDLNPCLTPYANSKEFVKHSSSSYNHNITTRCHDEVGFAQGRKLSKSSTDANSGKILGCRSDENNKYAHIYGMLHY